LRSTITLQERLVERLAAREALHLGDERVIGPPVGRAYPNIRATLHANTDKMVRTRRAGMDLDRHNVGDPPSQDLQIRQQLSARS
jgi:hypothetical protein